MKGEVQVDPAWNTDPLIACNEFRKNMICQLMGSVYLILQEAVLFLTCSTPSFFFLPVGLVSCTSGKSDKGDHWAAGLEGGGEGRVSLQLDQLRCCHRAELKA